MNYQLGKKPLFSLLIILGLFAGACASSDIEEEYNPNIHIGAYAVEGFVLEVAPPIHPEWKPQKFYFKQCEELGIGDHFTKIDYTCTYP